MDQFAGVAREREVLFNTNTFRFAVGFPETDGAASMLVGGLARTRTAFRESGGANFSRTLLSNLSRIEKGEARS